VIGEVLGSFGSREKRGSGNGGGHTGQNLVDKHLLRRRVNEKQGVSENENR